MATRRNRKTITGPALAGGGGGTGTFTGMDVANEVGRRRKSPRRAFVSGVARDTGLATGANVSHAQRMRQLGILGTNPNLAAIDAYLSWA